MSRNRLLTLVSVLLLVNGCTHATTSLAPADGISIMTFNVENLFDTSHDVGKNDQTYLPLADKQSAQHREGCARISVPKWRDQCLHWDWNQQVLDYKLEKIAAVIKQVNQGRGPDIIALQEVENKAVLERLISEYLPHLNYLDPILIEGKDLRGIDVAFLSKLPVVGEPQLHEIDFKDIEEKRRQDTRGILQADFRLPDGTIMSGFAVHFPAPFHPYHLRIDAYNSLNQLLKKLPARQLAFAAGDFNTPAAEDRKQQLLSQFVTPHWIVSHHLGCQNCPGTYYYAPKQEWSFLDMVLLRRGSGSTPDASRWRLRADQTTLVNRLAEQKDMEGYPSGFEIDGPGGVSDHWPLMIVIVP